MSKQMDTTKLRWLQKRAFMAHIVIAVLPSIMSKTEMNTCKMFLQQHSWSVLMHAWISIHLNFSYLLMLVILGNIFIFREYDCESVINKLKPIWFNKCMTFQYNTHVSLQCRLSLVILPWIIVDYGACFFNT